MMGGRLTCGVAAALSLFASAALAQTGGAFAYASGTVGALPGPGSFRSLPSEAQQAQNQSGGFRTEVEHYRSFGLTDPVTGASVENSSMMLNGMYDIPSGPRLKTFVGAGFGALNRTQRIPGASSDAWDSAYQVRGGLSYDISNAVSGLLEFRQQGILAGSSPKVSIKNRGILLGLKYQID